MQKSIVFFIWIWFIQFWGYRPASGGQTRLQIYLHICMFSERLRTTTCLKCPSSPIRLHEIWRLAIFIIELFFKKGVLLNVPLRENQKEYFTWGLSLFTPIRLSKCVVTLPSMLCITHIIPLHRVNPTISNWIDISISSSQITYNYCKLESEDQLWTGELTGGQSWKLAADVCSEWKAGTFHRGSTRGGDSLGILLPLFFWCMTYKYPINVCLIKHNYLPIRLFFPPRS